MVRIILEAGERLTVQLADGDGDLIDGEFYIDCYASEGNRFSIAASLPGNVVPQLEMRVKAAYREWTTWNPTPKTGPVIWEKASEEFRENWRSIVKAAWNAPFEDDKGRLMGAGIYEEEWDNSEPSDTAPVAPEDPDFDTNQALAFAGQPACDVTTMRSVGALSKHRHGSFGGGPDKD